MGIKDNTTIIIGKDAPACTLYAHEIAKLIVHRMRCADKESEADIKRLHEMAMEAMKTGV